MPEVTAATNARRGRDMIIGAMVADAAALGLHWIYDQKRVARAGDKHPEFTPIKEANYQKTKAFFAHASRKDGDLSNYGEQTLVMLESLEANKGRFDLGDYQHRFRKRFGPGGEYVGYIDRATRETLLNADAADGKLRNLLKREAKDANDETRTKLYDLFEPLARTHARPELVEAAEKAAEGKDSPPADLTRKLAEIVARRVPLHRGSADTQMPALSKLPPLVAARAGKNTLLDETDAAVSATNDNDCAREFGRAAARMLEAVALGRPLAEAVGGALASKSEMVRNAISKALEHEDGDSLKAAKEFGLACELRMGLPVVIHVIAHSRSYTDAVRKNILVGGDSCGRAILVGAVAGAVHGAAEPTGVPPSWICRLNQGPHITSLAERLTGT